ncbi:DUF4333 domain-containing protein [Blastococcus tunisiensis]|uniref:DUF4333 domain-containing protein n=1 Tax=Blastococcus tunisiensis TaxID=1798228 RepID=A0A1I2HRZ0_9ACTN|nr:DUF4333 domain-containing protein [Blastococcus sp. DSM 46838]SFF32193.1 protein of unknown function [Blastococcus sp. DSM 46838]
MASQTYPTPPTGSPEPQNGPTTYGPPSYGPPAGGYAPAPAPRRRTGAIIGGIVAAVVVLGGLVVAALVWIGGATLDTAEVERRIGQLTAEQAGVAPTDVSCPADIRAESGSAFSCTASLENQPISFTVTQTDDEGTVRIDSDNTFVDVGVVEASLDEQLGALTGVAVISTCDTGGHSVLVDAVGTPIPCFVDNAADATDTVEVVATVDSSGAVSYEFA